MTDLIEMQPELAPPDNQRVSHWHYVTLLPTFLAFGVVFVTVSAWFGEWGGDTRVATVLAVFFSEFMMVMCAAGLLGYLRQHQKCQRSKRIALWNVFLLLLCALSGLYLYMS